MEAVDDFQSDELVDPKQLMKEKRGKTLPILCVLSYVYIGYMAISAVYGFVKGPMSAEELEIIRIEAMKGIEADTPEMATKFIMDTIEYTVIQNDKFYLMSGLSLVIAAIGFLGVFMMYKLKKTGYFIYLAYAIAPIVIQMTIFPGNLIAKFKAFIIIGLFSVLFIILYGVQLKRME